MKRFNFNLVMIALLLFMFKTGAFQIDNDQSDEQLYQTLIAISDDSKINNQQKLKQLQQFITRVSIKMHPKISALARTKAMAIAAMENQTETLVDYQQELKNIPLANDEQQIINLLSETAETNLYRIQDKHVLVIAKAKALLDQLSVLPISKQDNYLDSTLTLSVNDQAFLNYIIANSYFVTTNYEAAQQHFLSAMQLYQSTKNLQGQATIYTNLAMLSWAQHNYEKALSQNEKAFNIALVLSNEFMWVNTMLNKGVYFQHLRQFDNALATFQKLLEHPRIDEYPERKIKALIAKADALQKIGLFEKSETFIQQALLIATANHDNVNLYTGKIALGNLLTQQKKYDEALKLYISAEKYFKNNQQPRLHSAALKSLSILFEVKKDFQQALSYHQQYATLSINNLRNAQKASIIRLNEQFQADNKEKQIQLLQQETALHQSNTQQAEDQKRFLLILVISSAIIIILLISRRYSKKEAAKLQQMNSDIAANEKQLMLLSYAFKSTSDAVFITDNQFNIEAVNNAFVQITHKTMHQVIGKKVNFATINGQDKNLADNIMLQAKIADTWQGELYEQRSNNEIYPIELEVEAIKNGQLEVIHYLGVFRDITARKKAQEQLTRLATHDDLTGLPNRALFESLIQQSCLNAKHVNKLPTLLLFDINGFKKINDSYGHQFGDTIICEIAKRLKRVLFTKDVIARINGAEFGILVELNNPKHSAVRVSKKIFSIFEQPFMHNEVSLTINASMGIALYPQDSDDAQELLRKAAVAMLDAKKTEGLYYRFYESKMNTSVMKQLEREQKLLNAINNQYFDFYYQPVVDLETDLIIGAEALIRWVEPDGTIISPAEFIPLAEQSEVIAQIDRIAIKQVFDQVAAWQLANVQFGSIAINLSAQIFSSPDELLTMLQAKISQTGVSPACIKFEITEGMLLTDVQTAIKTMRKLKALGFKLSLDDFGIGFSSLNYLKKFPVDCIKVDKSFIFNLHKSDIDHSIVKAIISLAETLHLQVIAEGVEQQAHVDLLKDMQCHQYQGFHFSKPLPVELFEIKLKNNTSSDLTKR
ncbi:EAL domain-containing protein [Thalassotalea hakodatensis]|uniref:EAL domain-containing protein n=1 Tax=Thalassotalea hakodatensis TaxID=3030492 RepID=UPI0025730B38|nr:EAL domain-containing protein [Thalassotalea hakodatensis]